MCSCDRGGELRLPSRHSRLHRCNAFHLQCRSEHDHQPNPFQTTCWLRPELFMLPIVFCSTPSFDCFTQPNVTVSEESLRIATSVSQQLEATHTYHATEHNSRHSQNPMQPTKFNETNATCWSVPSNVLVGSKIDLFSLPSAAK